MYVPSTYGANRSSEESQKNSPHHSSILIQLYVDNSLCNVLNYMQFACLKKFVIIEQIIGCVSDTLICNINKSILWDLVEKTVSISMNNFPPAVAVKNVWLDKKNCVI